MRLLYVSSGKRTLSDLNPNMIGAFRLLTRKVKGFRFESFLRLHESGEELNRKLRLFKPDVILVFGHDNHPVLPQLRGSGAPIGLWVVNDPYSLDNYRRKVPSYDFIITQDSGSIPFYQKMAKPCIHLPLAVNTTIYRPRSVPDSYASDVCFIGNGWPSRIRFFNRLSSYLQDKKFILIGAKWEKLNDYDRMKAGIINRTVSPQEAARYYNGAKVVLNIHRSPNDINKNPLRLPACTPNNRTFDIAACRAFQLLDQRRDLNRLYDPGREMVSFVNLKDLVEKMDYYLQHQTEREKIAARAYRRTIQDHTYMKRLLVLLQRLPGVIRKTGRRDYLLKEG
ncbi:glycosyltransferase [Kroppenstedtia pulmonis]|uniref:Glycosyltransferase n=2 Tax=Kroppenstedtia pulmonis TaxID=1380685 RepID=A0A7D3XNV5_9BACL|nr:glycosyltransferase [Kroppenstedtia pulmonis]